MGDNPVGIPNRSGAMGTVLPSPTRGPDSRNVGPDTNGLGLDRAFLDSLKQLQGLCLSTFADLSEFFDGEPTQTARVKLATAIDRLYQRSQSVRFMFPVGSMHLMPKDIELLQDLADHPGLSVYKVTLMRGATPDADRIRLHRIRRKLGVDSTDRAIAVAGALGLVRIQEVQSTPGKRS